MIGQQPTGLTDTSGLVMIGRQQKPTDLMDTSGLAIQPTGLLDASGLASTGRLQQSTRLVDASGLGSIGQPQPTGQLHSLELEKIGRQEPTASRSAMIGRQQYPTGIMNTAGLGSIEQQVHFSGRATMDPQQVERQRHVATTRKIGEMLAAGGLSFSFVENPAFVNLVRHLQPAYEVPSKEHFRDVVVSDLYHSMREKVSQLLSSSAKWIALTVDVLNQGQDLYVSVRGHWLTEEFHKNSVVLYSMIRQKRPFTSELYIKFGEVLDSWNIPKESVVGLIYNNAFSWRESQPGDILREKCFDVCLHSVVTESAFLEDHVLAASFRVEDAIEHFKHSAERLEKLAAWQRKKGLPVETFSSHSRAWMNTCQMFRQFVRQREAIEAYFREETKEELVLDWSLIESVLFVLEPFVEIGRMVTNLSDVVPAVTLLCKCLAERSVRHPIARAIKYRLIGSLKETFHDGKDSIEEKECYILATVLDPRYKLEFFSSDLLPILIKILQKQLNATEENDSGLAEDDEENETVDEKSETDVSSEKNEFDVFFDAYETASIEISETEVSSRKNDTDVSIDANETASMETNETVDGSVEKINETDVCIDTDVCIKETNISIDEKESSVSTPCNLWECYNEIVEHGMFKKRDVDFANEVNEYLNSNVVPRHVCPLTWWRDNRNKFPGLASMAQKYLSVPASCLSLSGKHCPVHDQVDYCHMPKFSDQLMFIHYNLSLL